MLNFFLFLFVLFLMFVPINLYFIYLIAGTNLEKLPKTDAVKWYIRSKVIIQYALMVFTIFYNLSLVIDVFNLIMSNHYSIDTTSGIYLTVYLLSSCYLAIYFYLTIRRKAKEEIRNHQLNN